MSERLPSAPDGAGAAGKRLWRSVVKGFVLDDHELPLLRAGLPYGGYLRAVAGDGGRAGADARDEGGDEAEPGAHRIARLKTCSAPSLARQLADPVGRQ